MKECFVVVFFYCVLGFMVSFLVLFYALFCLLGFFWLVFGGGIFCLLEDFCSFGFFVSFIWIVLFFCFVEVVLFVLLNQIDLTLTRQMCS